MSIFIRGMEMPTDCTECWFRKTTRHEYLSDCQLCPFTGDTTPYLTRDKKCPLVPVPAHGRLIEESKVLDIVSEWCPDDDGSVGKDGDLREMLDEIEALPTIIPADHTVDDTKMVNAEEGE